MNSEQMSMTTWLGVLLLVLLAIIGFYVFTEHRLRLFGILTYLLLLACPFMHMFMHHRHGKSSHDVGKHN